MNASLRDCPICRTAAAPKNRIGPLPANHHKLEGREYDLVTCPNCELIYLSPAPTTSDIRAMYTESSQFDQDDVYRGERGKVALDFYADRLRALLTKMNRAPHDKIRVLEIGAGLSWMCHAAKQLSPASVTVAQDITGETVQECTWVDQFCVEELSAHGVEGRAPYDVVSMTHVVEHLVDPVGTLRRIRDLIASEGLVFVTAPHRPAGWRNDDAIAKWQAWSYNHVPAHIQHFSSASMRLAAEGTAFTVVLWDNNQEDGQAFEAWLQPAPRGWQRIWAAARGSLRKAS